MPIYEAPLVSAVMSTATFLLMLWVVYSTRRHRQDPRSVRFRDRLRHPRTSADELSKRARGEQH